ncbi:MAG: hypothetical protein AAFQ94_21600 [Bacteroidota bacterium]
MKPVEFKIDFVFEDPVRKSTHFLATMLTKQESFDWKKNIRLGQSIVKEVVTVRSIDEEGNPRFDQFGFRLMNKSELVNFKKGMIVQLHQSD